MIMQIVRFKSELPIEEVREIAHERAKEFRAVAGLVQKYYLRSLASGEYLGVYVWDSKESLESYRDSELAATIPQAYGITKPPQIELLEVAFQLHG